MVQKWEYKSLLRRRELKPGKLGFGEKKHHGTEMLRLAFQHWANRDGNWWQLYPSRLACLALTLKNQA